VVRDEEERAAVGFGAAGARRLLDEACGGTERERGSTCRGLVCMCDRPDAQIEAARPLEDVCVMSVVCGRRRRRRRRLEWSDKCREREGASRSGDACHLIRDH